MTDSEFTYTGHENLLVMKHARNYNSFLANLIRKHGRDSDTVVDFGAGVGAFSEAVRPWASRLICVEPDSIQLNILKNAGYEVLDNISALPADSVDYVYSLNVFEHIEDDRAVMEQVFKVLNSGGRLLVYVPALQWLFTSMDAAVGHVRRYHMNDLVQKIVDAGFSVKRKEYVDSLGVVATLFYKWFGSSAGNINTKALTLYDRFLFPISRIIDKIFCCVAGKNLLIVCEKP